MSDAPQRGPGIPPAATVPLAAHPAPGAPVMHHRATQMSPSAVPSTLESPKDPIILLAPDATWIERPMDTTLPSSAGESPNGATLRDDSARDAAIREAARRADEAMASAAASASGEPSARRHGPATQMSPVPGASTAPPGPPLAAEDAVVDAVLPPAAFVPPTHGATLDMGSGGYTEAPQHAGWGAPGAHAGAFEARDPWAGARPMPSRPPPGMGAHA
ncbi:MAG TPA: hypothetical protein VLT33_37100, partial [Labilithrix sp.]|nr:hypothetical protein [Labilithrix sp.]